MNLHQFIGPLTNYILSIESPSSYEHGIPSVLLFVMLMVALSKRRWNTWTSKCGGGKRLRNYNITQPAVRGYIDGVLTPGLTACPHKHGDIHTRGSL